MQLWNIILISLLACLPDSGYSYFITVDAHAEECFHENVEMGTKLGKHFVYTSVVLTFSAVKYVTL